MMWAALFIGLIAGGLNARVALLSHRGGWLLEDQNAKPIWQVFVELFGTIVGIVGFVFGFLLFPWWAPVVAFAGGFWIVPTFSVSRATYPTFYRCSTLLSLISFGCAAFLIYSYLGT